MRMRRRRRASFHSTMICSPKKRMNWDMQPAGWVICSHTETHKLIKGHLCPCSQLWETELPPDLHLGVHAVVNGSPPGVGWTAGYHRFATRGQQRPLVLIKGLERRVVARGLKLEPGHKNSHVFMIRTCVNLYIQTKL